LPNALRYVLYRARERYAEGASTERIKESVASAVGDFIESSLIAVKKIGEIGAGRIVDDDVILTHCNSQAAIAILRHAHRGGKSISVFVSETRPRYQGRYTAEVLSKDGIPVSLIVDSAARYFMPKVDKVVIGADAVAANGAVVNKVGTSMIALAAHETRVNVMVGAETYKFSPRTFLGELIEIEERPTQEVAPAEWLSKNPGVSIRNPAFDVTPPEYIDSIVTEAGVVSPHSILFLVKDRFGWAYGKEEPWA
ncbi:MAG: ribose 1,5-bisphosphate isomerase, partial [Candidatus Bathyarchaeia archaeon]